MLRTRDDLRASIAGCADAAPHGISTPSCTAGVLMENSLRFAGRPAFPRAAAQACVRASLGRACLDNVGIVAALAVDHDAARAAALCRRLRDAADRAACATGARDEIAEAHGQ